jgi:hypothetical protein
MEKLKKGHKAAGKSFKVHIDGFNLLPYLTGEEPKSPRPGFIYFSRRRLSSRPSSRAARTAQSVSCW